MSTATATTSTQARASQFRRRGQALALWTAPGALVVANTAYAWSTRHGGSDETAAGALALSAAHPDLDAWATAAAMLGCLLLIPAVLGAMSVVRRDANRLGLAAGILMVAGYVCYFALNFQGLATIALARHGGANAQNIAAYDVMTNQPPYYVVAITFVLGNIVGTFLLGLALLRSRTVRRWAAFAVMAWPVLHIVGGTWGEVAGSIAQAVGLAVVGRRVLATGPASPAEPDPDSGWL